MRLAKLSDLFSVLNPNLFVASIAISVFTGLFYAFLVPFITYVIGLDIQIDQGILVENKALFDSPTETLAKFYLAVCISIILLRTIANVITEFIGSFAIMKFRMSVYQKILDLSLLDIQLVGQSRLVTLLNQDVQAITQGAMSLPLVWISTCTVLGVMGYLVYLDIRVFAFVLLTILIGGATYYLPVILATRYFARARAHMDTIQEGARAIIFGASELKLDNQKALEFFEEELATPEKKAMRENVKGISIFVLGSNYGEILAFLVIGIVIFHLPYVYDLSQLQLVGIGMSILYLSGPLAVILNSFGAISSGKVALKKVNQVYDELTPELAHKNGQLENQWQEIYVRNLQFEYPGKGQGFGIDISELVFQRGEISYIIGGNGSGKSTLSRCLTLHFQPQSGHIAFGKNVITADNIYHARHQVSAIYSNFFLFNGLYAKARAANSKQLKYYLDYLQLTDKLQISEHKFSSTALSDGQRKRVALLCALLEDRDIYVFDEWAADQDPMFKEMFYKKVLPELKDKNKVVIVITHDDRYFDCADQLITMESGKVRSIERLETSQVA